MTYRATITGQQPAEFPTARQAWRHLAGNAAPDAGQGPPTGRCLAEIAEAPQPFRCADGVTHDPDGPGVVKGPGGITYAVEAVGLPA